VSNFSDYIIYVDESGDHGMDNIDNDYPIFVLAFCIFKKQDYINKVVPEFQNFKFKHWGHDAIILHEHDIRKNRSDYYAIFNDKAKRKLILNDISNFIDNASFEILSYTIKKDELKKNDKGANPYELSLILNLRRLHYFLIDNHQENKIIDLVFESRGTTEDNALKLIFLGCVKMFPKIQYNIHFIKKTANQAGLQIADLTARPIGLQVLRPEQSNRTYDILKSKLINNYIFPSTS
jgi:hypothetical protein